MADTFTTSLSIRQIETGTRSGTWGTETNTQYELLDNAFSYVNHDLSSDADATLTISDGSASDARYFFIKFTSSVSLTATRTITLAPDDSKKLWIVENATTGSQSLTFKQGSSGSTVTVANGSSVMIYADGAGATNGAIVNALTDLDLAGTTTVGGLDAGSGSITTTGTVTGGTLAGTLSTAAQTNVTSVGTLSSLTVSGDATFDTSTLKVDSSNNRVGIGTASPSTGVTVATSANISQVAITSSSNSVAWDAKAAANAYHATTENTTFSAPTNAVEGAIISVEIAQGGTPYTVAWNTAFEFAASTAPTVTATANKTDIFSFRYNGTVWQEIGRVQNLAQT
jgi:hypothetical protein